MTKSPAPIITVEASVQTHTHIITDTQTQLTTAGSAATEAAVTFTTTSGKDTSDMDPPLAPSSLFPHDSRVTHVWCPTAKWKKCFLPISFFLNFLTRDSPFYLNGPFPGHVGSRFPSVQVLEEEGLSQFLILRTLTHGRVSLCGVGSFLTLPAQVWWSS